MIVDATRELLDRDRGVVLAVLGDELFEPHRPDGPEVHCDLVLRPDLTLHAPDAAPPSSACDGTLSLADAAAAAWPEDA